MRTSSLAPAFAIALIFHACLLLVRFPEVSQRTAKPNGEPTIVVRLVVSPQSAAQKIEHAYQIKTPQPTVPSVPKPPIKVAQHVTATPPVQSAVAHMVPAVHLVSRSLVHRASTAPSTTVKWRNPAVANSASPSTIRTQENTSELPATNTPAEVPQTSQTQSANIGAEQPAAPQQRRAAPQSPPPAVPAVVNSTPGPITRQAQPRYRNDPPPKYPDEARRENEQGVVLVRASIDSSGAVTGVQIEKSCGFLQLDKAAVSAVQNWQFDPAESEKKPVPSVVLIPVGFHLSTQND